MVNLRMIIEKARQRSQALYHCFVDVTKAFDMGRHDRLWSRASILG